MIFGQWTATDDGIYFEFVQPTAKNITENKWDNNNNKKLLNYLENIKFLLFFLRFVVLPERSLLWDVRIVAPHSFFLVNWN